MVSVADVSTTVERENTRSRNRSATDSGATRSTGRIAPRLSSWSSHTTSVRSGMAGPNDASTRDAVSEISLSAATASARADAALGSLVVSIAERAALAARARRGDRCAPACRRGWPRRRVSSAVATAVTRSTSSCASSMTSSACSGRIAESDTASMASSAWLVTTTSA